MNKVINQSREGVSDSAPQFEQIKVHPDKIRDIIGKGGATIRSITEETGASVDIDDDGTVKVYGETGDSLRAALDKIGEITAEAEIGTIYEGKVVRIVDFGAFVNFLPGKDGLVHISQIAEERVNSVTDYLQEGQMVRVKCLDVDQRGRIKLSIKEAARDEAPAEEAPAAEAPQEEGNAE
jgi:polyribonucleotide nucleotidyltransferase